LLPALQVIKAMVAHQNHVLRILARSGTGEVAPEWPLMDLPQDAQIQQPLQNLSGTASPHPWAQCNSGYVLYLMQHTSNSLVQQATQMSATDWSTYFINCFTRLVTLLELITRYSDEEVAAAITAAGNVPLNHAGPGPAGQLAPAAGRAGPAPPGCSLATDLQQLEQVVDEWVLLIVLGLVLNPLAIATATSLNHASGQEDSAPPHHYNRVVQRLQLSSEQGLQFSVALEEFNRLRHAAFHETGSLLPDVACPGLMVLAAEAEKGAAALQEITDLIHGSATASSSLQWKASRSPSSLSAAAATENGRCSSQKPAAASLSPSNSMAAIAPAVGCDVIASHVLGPAEVAASPVVSESIAQSDSRGTWEGSRGSRRGCSSRGNFNSKTPCFQADADLLLVRSIQSAPMFAQLLHAINCNILSKFQIAKLVSRMRQMSMSCPCSCLPDQAASVATLIIICWSQLAFCPAIFDCYMYPDAAEFICHAVIAATAVLRQLVLCCGSRSSSDDVLQVWKPRLLLG
jgi:hypothetical protein